MHYKNWQNIVFNPYSQNSWKSTLENYYSTDKYKMLNSKVSRDPRLARLASMNFLSKITESIQNRGSGVLGSNAPPNLQNNPGGFFDALDQLQAKQGQNCPAAQQSAAMLQSAVDEATDESLQMAEMANGFTHEGISMACLDDPEKMREMLSNRLVVSLLSSLRKLSEMDEGKTAVRPSPRRGMPIGVKTMRSFSEVVDIIPMELLNDDLLTYRIATRKAQVRERYSGLAKYLVYLDKSGSMASGGCRFDDDYMPNISFASACVISMASHLRKNGGSLLLKMFDSDIHEEISDFWELVETAASVRADGGTNITKVLEDSLDYHDYKVVVVSDGIDSVEQQMISRTQGKGISFVLLNTDNKLIEENFVTQKVTEFKDNFLLEV